MLKEKLPYRKSVGMMLLNKQNQVFIGKRNDTRVSGWQMPQGGVDEHEDLEIAAMRELKEEIGTNNVEIIARTKDWLYYDLPDELIPKFWQGKYCGQQQIWFMMRFLGSNKDVNLNYHQHVEFSDWRWAEIKELPEIIVSFKKSLYLNVIKEFMSFGLLDS